MLSFWFFQRLCEFFFLCKKKKAETFSCKKRNPFKKIIISTYEESQDQVDPEVGRDARVLLFGFFVRSEARRRRQKKEEGRRGGEVKKSESARRQPAVFLS